jgi:hypothetical protein
MTVRHIVLMKVRAEVAESEVSSAMSELGALVGEIPGLLSFVWGRNDSPEAAGKSYTHGFIMEFADEASRDAYLPDPRHQKAAQGLRAIREAAGGVTIVDFSA